MANPSSGCRRLLETCVLRFITASSTLLTRIQKSQIELAIISTYALQLSWIYTFFSPSTPVVLVTQPAPSENGSATIKQVLPNWIRVTPFLRGGRGVMHMKVRMASTGISALILTWLRSSYCSSTSQEDYASSFQPRTSWITIGATSKIRSGSRMCLAGRHLSLMNLKLMTFPRFLNAFFTRSTSRLLLPT